MRYSRLPIKELISYFLLQGKEGEFWDFKQELLFVFGTPFSAKGLTVPGRTLSHRRSLLLSDDPWRYHPRV